MAIACARRGLPARFGRGFDDLPGDVLAAPSATECLLREAGDVVPMAARVGPCLRELLGPPGS